MKATCLQSPGEPPLYSAVHGFKVLSYNNHNSFRGQKVASCPAPGVLHLCFLIHVFLMYYDYYCLYD